MWCIARSVTICTILKNVKNIHGRVLILVKLQTEDYNFTKINTPLWVFFMFFKLHKWYCNFTKISTPPWVFFTYFKLYKLYQIAQRTIYWVKAVKYFFKKIYILDLWQCTKYVSNFITVKCYHTMFVLGF